jgi:hypothetical protein
MVSVNIRSISPYSAGNAGRHAALDSALALIETSEAIGRFQFRPGQDPLQ